MKKVAITMLCAIALTCFSIPFACVDRGKTPPVVTMPDTAQIIKTAPGWFCADTVPANKVQKRLTLLKNKNWTNGQTIKVGFIGGTAAQQQRIKDAYAEWSKYLNLKFEFPATGNTDHRWSFTPGSAYSYIGTDCNYVGQAYNTGNIGFTQNGLSVETHEVGHALGFAHEQSSPNAAICWNKPQVYADLGGSPNFWSQATVDANVFAKYSNSLATATAFDPVSIMEYRIQNNWTCDGKGIPGGVVLSDLDKTFAASVYPGVVIPPINPPTTSITITAAQATELKQAALNAQTATNTAKAAVDANRAKIQAILGQ